MEEDQKIEPVRKSKKRRVSLFKKRKKSDIRPFVREKKHREYKKLLRNFAICVLLLFLIAAILYGIKMYVVSGVFHKNTVIINPSGSSLPSNDQILSTLHNKGLSIEDIQFATDSATLIFVMDGKVKVYLSKEKDINDQLDMVEAIDKQMIEDGKQAFSIDLRYNKPIVKF